MATVRLPVRSSFLHCLRVAPLAVVALLLYVALPSRFLLPPDFSLTELAALWHPALAGWYDGLLGGALLATWLTHGLKMDSRLTAFAYLCLAATVLSLLFGYPHVSAGLVGASVIYWLRVTALLCFAIWLTERGGPREIEALLVVSGLLLCASALFVYRLQWGINGRMYASAMSVASFSQIVVVALFIAITRKHMVLFCALLPFLILTFSWTSITLFCALVGLFMLHANGFGTRHVIVGGGALAGTLIAGTLLALRYPQFADIRQTFTNVANASTLHGRTMIWTYGIDLIRSGAVGPFGIGLNRSPLVLHRPIIVFTSARLFAIERETYAIPVHFHSILLELGVGVGLPSLGLLYILGKRIVQGWRLQCHVTWLIFAFFLLSQSLDFTFFRPKELVLWSLALGTAEGHLRWQERLLASGQQKQCSLGDE